MYVIGVTGGIGAGKSEVLAYLEEEWGAQVVRLDDVSRELLAPGAACFDAAVELLGRGILREDGTIDRGKAAEIIFGDESKRQALDALIHPAVKKETSSMLAIKSIENCPLFVIEAALLIEDHYDAICDEMWYIYADADTRCRRLVETRGYTRERAERMMARQLSDEAFRAGTQLVIDNGGDFEAAKAQVDARLGELHMRRHEEPAEVVEPLSYVNNRDRGSDPVSHTYVNNRDRGSGPVSHSGRQGRV